MICSPRFRAREPLQQFLQYQSGDNHRFAAVKRAAQGKYHGGVGWGISAQSQRPDAGIDEQAHDRLRTGL
jgi:hypothetical protein